MDRPVAALNQDTVVVRLPATTADGRARRHALAAIDHDLRQASAFVTYRSEGRLLVIASNEDDAGAALDSLRERVRCVLLVVGNPAQRDVNRSVAPRVDGITVLRAPLATLTGHLGAFRAEIAATGGVANLAALVSAGAEHFDLVLDLTSPPVVWRELPPPGYYAPGADPQALQRALVEIPETIGEFEKPKYFHYNPDICAHGASGLKGCTRCLDVCPTLAIRSIGDKIEVDAHLCQGAGSCATVCPTGAMGYGYPPAADLLGNLRVALRSYRDAGGKGAVVLFYDTGDGRQWLAACAAQLPEQVIPFEVEEIGSVGMEVWLSALAYGANRIAVLATPAVVPSVTAMLREQIAYTTPLLEGLGHAPSRLRLFGVSNDAELLAQLVDWSPEPELVPAGFAALNEKRTTLRLAVDHLHAHAAKPRRTVPLPAGAPFGEILVDRERCTLCMACVGVCPASALADGADLPQLRFREWNCVQCGLCEAACPEQAITRVPRFLVDPVLRQETRVLNEQQPFHCIQCGKPFATQALMDRMKEKLEGHWMFATPDAMRRLQMCEDCRVRSMFRESGSLIDMHRPH